MAQQNLSGREAMARLIEGNRRYMQNVRSVDSMLSHSRRDLQTQRPIAIVLGCSDSRAPAEVVFDQGLGDLFVIRVAGNIVAPSQIGSVEFAAERFSPLAAADGSQEGPLRQALVGSQLLGLGFQRYVLRSRPLATATPEQIAAWAGPTVEHYLRDPLPRRPATSAAP